MLYQKSSYSLNLKKLKKENNGIMQNVKLLVVHRRRSIKSDFS